VESLGKHQEQIEIFEKVLAQKKDDRDKIYALHALEVACIAKGKEHKAAIEPIIGHAKSDYGLKRNYLKGEIGDAINAILAASAFNFKSWMRKATARLIFAVNYLRQICRQLPIHPKINGSVFNC
jgi:hypothetical protein